MTNDPFAEPDEEGTIIRPRPRGVDGHRPRPVVAIPPLSLEAAAVPQVGINRLVSAAAPLLAAASRIAKGRGQPPDIDRLRHSMVIAIGVFERASLATGLDTRSLRAARYALCATIDDLVFSMPWGATSSWAQQSLTSIFHNEVSGGERFFDILEQMEKDMGRHGEVVELMYLCASLGFEGRYRVLPRGVAAQTELRDSVYRLIRNRRGEFERDLSPHWKGADLGNRALSRRPPLWAVGVGALAIACMIYVGFDFALATASDVPFAQLLALPPTGPIAVFRATTPPPPPPPPAELVTGVASARLHQFLALEIKEGLVQLFEDAQSVTVRLTNSSMFDSGSATLEAGHSSVLDRIGTALEAEKGQVIVRGYTDNRPIRTVRFPSNFQLSQERAETVAAVIRRHLSNSSRVQAEGRGEADPIADNDSPSGRQQNRRTEVVLVRAAPASP